MSDLPSPRPALDKELVFSLVRNILKIGGTALLTSGIADEATLEQIIGGAMALFGLLWTYYFHAKRSN